MSLETLRVLQLAGFMLFISGSALASGLDEKLLEGVKSDDLPGLHGAIVELDQQRLAESYFAGEDQSWGEVLGVVEHGPETLHDLRSVTKSIVGLVYGIALAEGKVPPIDKPLYAQFPEYPDLQKQPGRNEILIEHALSMQMGIEWNEDLPYSDPKNSEIAMEYADDRYRYALEQKILYEPGTKWIYSGGAVALVVNAACGEEPDDARRAIYLRYVGDLTTWHLRLLELFHDPLV